MGWGPGWVEVPGVGVAVWPVPCMYRRRGGDTPAHERGQNREHPEDG